MTGFNRQQCIDDFIGWMNQPFVNVFHVSQERADLIAHDHFQPVRAITDDMVQNVVRIMQTSITENADHYRIREWMRCCRGVADYILRPGDIDGVDRLIAAGVLVRLSGYVHHCPAFFAAFRPAATDMERVMKLDLPYLKTGGDITIDTNCVGEDGYITLWNFAKGSEEEDEVLRSESEVRTLASRILNFICLHHYKKVRITQQNYDEIEDSFNRNEHTLYRWSVTNDWVDFIASRLEVPANDVIAFLYPPPPAQGQRRFPFPAVVGRQTQFDSNQMYKPDRDRRFDWFSNEWNIVADPNCVSSDGYVTLWNFWNFAKKSPDELTRSVSEIRSSASRILNFLCLKQYRDARIAQQAHDYIAQYDLSGWSLDDRMVNRTLANIAVRWLEVPASTLPAFLQSAGFDPKRGYNPDRPRRQEWFTKELKTV